MLICFEVVPEATSPWKPLIEPHAIVTNSIGNNGGDVEFEILLIAGASKGGLAIKMPKKINPKPTINW